LYQGSWFQVSLAGSVGFGGFPWGGAFLFAIVLTQYLPENRVHVSLSVGFPGSIRFLNNRPVGCIGWHLLIVSTTDESSPTVTPFHLSVFCPRRWMLSTACLWDGRKKYFFPFSTTVRKPVVPTRTILVKPLILLWLLNHDDGSVASSFMSMLLLTPHP